MLIIVHYGDASVLLVNGNCQPIHLLNYIRTNCCLSPSIKFDLCLINTGQPFHLSSTDSKLISSERYHLFRSHAHCVLTRIDGNIYFDTIKRNKCLSFVIYEEGTYIPLLNDPTLITTEFLAKLKRATTTTKINFKTGKQSNHLSNEEIKKGRSLRSFAIAATVMNKYKY